MRAMLPCLLLLLTASTLSAQNEQIIAKANGFAIKCTILKMDSAQIVYSYRNGKTSVIDTIAMSEVYSISYPSHGITRMPDFSDKLYRNNGNINLQEQDKKLYPQQLKLLAAYHHYKGKKLAAYGGSYFGVGLVMAGIGTALIVKADSFNNSIAANTSGSVLTAFGGFFFLNGLHYLPEGCVSLKKSKLYKKELQYYPADVAFGPTITTEPNFPSAAAYGMGLKLTF